ncbi:transferase hexapeptide repeat containing protein [Ruminiclostridium papyrosolvens DSM 2782]|uniref:Transferase hexapeptide repeat containing protein n=1 Tax=Ruminiclostridium papyrosolvens DSM 2782 TaxID=588581 RepID=F1THB2_9FIRM|nr:gamma carbonic anhydrase family protein [Ruminiclostridium papyrosolvens]EGD46115.1 transferase hexapeptide repeat containing protein [Ruminiclostridium papyrosolvens DSM 2782]WES35900.1 gamma carbonic anhydrase family protein [Ruminiclostridium papyrosolvens DSM 2782]
MIKDFNNITPKIHETAFVAPNSTVIGDVVLGENTTIWYNAVLRGDIDSIVVGDNTNIQEGCILHCKTGIEVKLGSHVTIGHGAILHSCSIGNNTLVGMGAIVLDSAEIGNNCLVAAGSVVTPRTKIPDGCLVAGSPAEVKRTLSDQEIAEIKCNANEYINLLKFYK